MNSILPVNGIINLGPKIALPKAIIPDQLSKKKEISVWKYDNLFKPLLQVHSNIVHTFC